MRLVDILLLTMLITVAVPTVNAMSDATGSPIFGIQASPVTGWSVANLQSGSQCVIQDNGTAVCTPTLSTSSPSLLSTILFWGDIFGALGRFITAMIAGVVLPAYMAIYTFHVSPVVAVIINAGVWFEYFLFYTYFLSGRFTGHG